MRCGSVEVNVLSEIVLFAARRVPLALLQLVVFVLLFLGGGVILDLHSFPTRRSSDLMEPMRCVLDLGRRDAGQEHHQDRKSTRLNSSHLGISYAVFCLKKKNLNAERQQWMAVHETLSKLWKMKPHLT